jgi:hypothetical protein
MHCLAVPLVPLCLGKILYLLSKLLNVPVDHLPARVNRGLAREV